ncbi:hypothetical protein [Fibrivirga algicola]|uniref:Transposase n=1 Tax=Fibrivirga algicola TaxID=2950420 RepID=A0ABX0QMH1_9BACT|nr:hypothetical protein [Fibrivirga algicola]NID12998.1 hypothetical protein [Fibrivirga algicola]
MTIFSDVSKQAENYSISLYDQLIQEGVEKGIEAGIDQTNRKAIRAMLTLNMEKAMIASALELPIEQVDRYIEQLNSSKLQPCSAYVTGASLHSKDPVT